MFFLATTMKRGGLISARRHCGENGSALIVVLALIALGTVLAASSAAITQRLRYRTASISQKTYSAYAAEGLAARLQWYILNDCRIYPVRELGVEDLDTSKERFLADGTIHSIDYHGMQLRYRILDSASGIDISSSTARQNLESIEKIYDGDKLERFRAFMNKFEDYTDTNNLLRLNGMEFDDYEVLGLYPLPRNRFMEFKEEILFIPGATEFFFPDRDGRLSALRTIPPKNMSRLGRENSIFGASKEMIMAACSMTDEEAERVINARSDWFREGKSMSTSLDTGVFTLLKNKFSFKESGFYSIEVDSAPSKDKVGKKLFISVRISGQISNPGIRYYEWLSY